MFNEFYKVLKFYYALSKWTTDLLDGTNKLKVHNGVENCLTDAEIAERVMNFGPSVWTALCSSSSDLAQFIENEEMKLIVLLQTQQKKMRKFLNK